jgi:hypothetical protein
MAMSEQQMVDQVERNVLSAFKKLGLLSENAFTNLIFKLDRLHERQKHEREETPQYTPSTYQME